MQESGVHIVCIGCGKLSPGTTNTENVEPRALRHGWRKLHPEEGYDKRWHCAECAKRKEK